MEVVASRSRERVDERQLRAARVTEEMTHTLGAEHLEQHITTITRRSSHGATVTLGQWAPSPLP